MSDGAASSNWVTDSIYCFKVNGNGSQLENDFRVYNQEFDEQGNLLLELTQVFQNREWVNHSRVINSYNFLNQLEESSIENFDLELRGWFFNNRSFFKYNSNGFLLEMESQTFSNGFWKPEFRNFYTYFNNTDPDEFTQQVFRNGVWINNFKVFNSFNTNGQITSTLFTTWDNTTRRWVNNNRTFDRFDEHNRLIESNKEIWIDAENRWLISSRDLIDYEELMERRTQEFWQNFDSTWVPEMEILITFNENEQQVERVERQFENGKFDFFFRSENEYDEFFNLKLVNNFLYTNNAWDLISHCEFFHSGEISSTETTEIFTNRECSFENPINRNSVITCNEFSEDLSVKVMDTTGRIIYAKDHQGEFSINENLNDGLYFLSILSRKENKLFTHLIAWQN